MQNRYVITILVLLWSQVSFAEVIFKNSFEGDDLEPPTLMAVGPLAVTPNIRINVSDGPDDMLFFAADPNGDVLTIDDADGNIMTANNGVITIDTASGLFSYDPPPGFTGSGDNADSFQYRVCDPGLLCSDNVTIFLEVTGTVVWFVDSTADAGDGSLQSPFNTLAGFNAANGNVGGPQPGQTIFLAAGAYTGGASLLDNQHLLGQGLSGTNFDNEVLGAAAATHSITRPLINLTPASITSANGAGVTLASGNSLRGFDIGNTLAAGLFGNSFGVLTVSDLIISGTGPILNLNTGTLNAIFNGLETTNASVAAISITGATNGSFTVSDGIGVDTSIAGATTGISIQGSEAIFSFAQADINTTGIGLDLGRISGNPNAGFSFDGLNITTTNSSGLIAINSGELSVLGTGNTLITGAGRAINLTNTTIGPDGMTFQSVSVDGAVNGILLDTTGNAGGLSITGDGSNNRNGSGGSIENTSSHGIVLNDTQDFSASSLNLFSPGDGLNEHGINAINLRGDNRLSGLHINGIGQTSSDGIRIINNSADLDLLEINNTIIEGVPGGGNDGVFVYGLGNSVMRVDIIDSTFNSLQGDGLQVNPDGDSIVNVNILGSTFSTTQENLSDNTRVSFRTGDSGSLTVVIQSSVFDDTGTQTGLLPVSTDIGAVDFVANDMSDMIVRFRHNDIINIDQEVGIRLVGDDNTLNMDMIIEDNDFEAIQGEDAIFAYFRDATQLANLTINNNRMGMMSPIAEHGIQLRAQSRNTVTGGEPNNDLPVIAHVVISNNTIINNGFSESIDLEAEVDSSDGSSFNPASTLNITLSDNLITNQDAFGAEVEVDSEDGPVGLSGRSLVCLDMTTNSLDGGAGELADLDENPGADLDVVQDVPGTPGSGLDAVNLLALVDMNGTAPNFAAVVSCTQPVHDALVP